MTQLQQLLGVFVVLSFHFETVFVDLHFSLGFIEFHNGVRSSDIDNNTCFTFIIAF